MCRELASLQFGAYDDSLEARRVRLPVESGAPIGRGECAYRENGRNIAMGLCVIFVSGPRRSGKSAVVRTMIDRLWERKPHYIRLVKEGGDKGRPKEPAPTPSESPIASARWLEYDADRIFEILPEALAAIHKEDRFGSVVLEADTDSELRHAYPYDHRLFVMPNPARIDEVFRNPHGAAAEFQRVLDDTQAFASEVFGLTDAQADDCDPPEDRQALSASQIRSFLRSPLGDELATRIQLHQPYQALVESDVIVVNTRIGTSGPETAECLRRIKELLQRLRGSAEGHGELFICDPCDPNAEYSRQLLEALEPMCLGGT